jgi:hypothetical protein
MDRGIAAVRGRGRFWPRRSARPSSSRNSNLPAHPPRPVSGKARRRTGRRGGRERGGRFGRAGLQGSGRSRLPESWPSRPNGGDASRKRPGCGQSRRRSAILPGVVGEAPSSLGGVFRPPRTLDPLRRLGRVRLGDVARQKSLLPAAGARGAIGGDAIYMSWCEQKWTGVRAKQDRSLRAKEEFKVLL